MIMNIKQDFEKLLAEGIAKGVFAEKQVFEMETCLQQYEVATRDMAMLIPYMSRMIELKKYEAA
jgi:biotin carboxylase